MVAAKRVHVILFFFGPGGRDFGNRTISISSLEALHPPEGSVAVSRTRLVFSVVFISCGSRVSFSRISSSFPLRQRAGTVEIICLLKAGPTTVRRASQHWVVSWCADLSCHPWGWPHVSHPGGKVWWRRGHRPGRSAARPHWSAPVPSHGKLKILTPRSSSWGRASAAAPWGNQILEPATTIPSDAYCTEERRCFCLHSIDTLVRQCILIDFFFF